VIGFVGFSILQVGGGELRSGCNIIVDSRQPQRFEVEQVSGVFLGRPFLFRFRG